MLLMTGKRGLCFVGCNINFVLADETNCNGFTSGLAEGYAFGASVYCKGHPDRDLGAEPLIKGTRVSGTLDGEPVSVMLK